MSKKVDGKVLMTEKTEKTEKTVGERAFISLWCLFLIPFSIVLRAWALTNLWSWSLVKVGVPAIGIVTASMLIILYQFVDCTVMKMSTLASKLIKEKSTSEIIGRVFCRSILIPPLVVGFAWVIKWVLTAIFGS